MSLSREALRRKAKKVYKENTKNVPRGRRIPFAQFFKQYKAEQQALSSPIVEEPDQEDFDFDSLVSVNDVGEEDDTNEED